MGRWLFIILLLLGFALHPARAEESPEPPNYCHSPESWAEWDQLLAQHPHDRGLQTLHALRLGICLKVDRGEITLDDGRFPVAPGRPGQGRRRLSDRR